jgi:hypothetical protein
MKPLPNCELCHGDGKYLDRYEECFGIESPVYEPCPCVDREEPITQEEYEDMHEDGILRGAE